MPKSWAGRMVIVVLAEKILAMVFFACANSIKPFDVEWVKNVLLAVPGLLVIDLFYGRIVFYAAACLVFGLGKARKPILEGMIYFGSLLLSLGVIIGFTGKVEVLLLYGLHPWNCFAYYMIATSGILAALLSWHGRFRSGRVDQGDTRKQM